MAERKSTKKVKRSKMVDGYASSTLNTPKRGKRQVHYRHVGKASPTGRARLPMRGSGSSAGEKAVRRTSQVRFLQPAKKRTAKKTQSKRR